MTSKEALKILFMTCDEELLQYNYNILFASQLEEIIRKDLDKLEKSSWKYDVLPPTIEEVKKEWEQLGYEIIEDNNIILKFKKGLSTIQISKIKKVYKKVIGCEEDNRGDFLTLQEHQLLTKTMKVLR